jgi:omega-6 fatty acid desaturase (delta-12 desaturase)
MGAFMNYMTGNIGYHHIHHLNAKIPFYRLPEAYEELPELQRARVTSLRPQEILCCLSLKVWDVEHQKLLPLKEAFAN